jgi:hypothetical protein
MVDGRGGGEQLLRLFQGCPKDTSAFSSTRSPRWLMS